MKALTTNRWKDCFETLLQAPRGHWGHRHRNAQNHQMIHHPWAGLGVSIYYINKGMLSVKSQNTNHPKSEFIGVFNVKIISEKLSDHKMT